MIFLKTKWLQYLLSLSLCFLVFGLSNISQAQESGGELEALYDSLEDEESDNEDIVRAKKTKKTVVTKKDKRELKKISELSSLEPFKDVAVISRKYLPKTKRFEGTLQASLSVNNAFFNNLGGSLKLGYYFTEKIGLGLNYSVLSDSEKKTTEDLKSKAGIQTRSFVTPQSYMGIDFKWAPMYGKMALFEDKIVSFDLFFSLGIGQTKTEEESGEMTLSAGMGQLYAITKSMAFRWDLLANFYNATIRTDDPNNPGQLVESKDSHFDVYISVGVSFFFPEATYR